MDTDLAMWERPAREHAADFEKACDDLAHLRALLRRCLPALNCCNALARHVGMAPATGDALEAEVRNAVEVVG